MTSDVMWAFYSPWVPPKSHLLRSLRAIGQAHTGGFFNVCKKMKSFTKRSNDGSLQGHVSQVKLLKSISHVDMLWWLFCVFLSAWCALLLDGTSSPHYVWLFFLWVHVLSCPYLQCIWMFYILSFHGCLLFHDFNYIGCLIVFLVLDACFELPLGCSVFGCLALPVCIFTLTIGCTVFICSSFCCLIYICNVNIKVREKDG
jgi:hypothetical protein